MSSEKVIQLTDILLRYQKHLQELKRDNKNGIGNRPIPAQTDSTTTSGTNQNGSKET